MRIINRLICAIVGLLAVFPTGWTQAQTWPEHTVKIVVPLPPGNSTDFAARLFAERLATRWRQPVVIENRQGGDGIPAVTAFLADRDHHTLLLSFGGVITMNPLVHARLPYDPARDLVPISPVTNNFLAFGATEAIKITSIDDLKRAARAAPGKLNWAATPGLPLYAFETLLKNAGLNMTQVAYRDFAPALQDFKQGRIEFAATGVLPLLTNGKVLAVLNRQRYPAAPEIPTIAEAGHSELTLDAIVGLYGWRDMPVELKERIAADVRSVGADPAIAPQLLAGGSVVTTGTPAEFTAAIEDQRATIARMVQAGGIKPAQ